MPDKPQPLKGFLERNKITLSRLAIGSRHSRDHLTNIRDGKADPSLSCMKAVLEACRRITGQPVDLAELFDIRPKRKAS